MFSKVGQIHHFRVVTPERLSAAARPGLPEKNSRTPDAAARGGRRLPTRGRQGFATYRVLLG